MNYYEFRAMTTDIVLAAEGRPDSIKLGFEKVSLWIKACEQRFSRFIDTSELADLNRSDGRWFQASPDMFDLLTEAYELVDQTSGIFDPSVLPELERAGYNRTIDEIREKHLVYEGNPSNNSHPIKLSHTSRISFSSTRLEPKDMSIRLQPGMRIDLGGIAKGWIAERAAYMLAAYADGVAVNIGGDMALVGHPQSQSRWQIGLEDPRDPAVDLAVLAVGPDLAVATSSVVKRRWFQSDQIRHHLIDPRSGGPAETDWLSVTAIARHGAQAEAFAKSLLIAGSKDADKIARGFTQGYTQGYPELAYIAVDQNGVLWGSENSKEFLNVAEKI